MGNAQKQQALERYAMKRMRRKFKAMQVENEQFDIFFSHSHAKEPFMAHLFDVFTALGFKVWLDEDISDDDMAASTQKIIANSTVTISFVDQSYQQSLKCQAELQHARNVAKKPVLVVMVEGNFWTWSTDAFKELCDVKTKMFADLSDEACQAWDDPDKVDGLLDALTASTALQDILKILKDLGCRPSITSTAFELPSVQLEQELQSTAAAVSSPAQTSVITPVAPEQLDSEVLLKEDQRKLESDVIDIRRRVEILAEIPSPMGFRKCVERIAGMKKDLDAKLERAKDLSTREALLGVPGTDFSIQLEEARVQLEPMDRLWSNLKSYVEKNHMWQETPLADIDPEEAERTADELYRTMQKLGKEFDEMGEKRQAPKRIADGLQNDLKDFIQGTVPLMLLICNPGMKERHWEDIQKVTGLQMPKKPPFTVSMMTEIGLQNYVKEIEDICVRASKEYGLLSPPTDKRHIMMSYCWAKDANPEHVKTLADYLRGKYGYDVWQDIDGSTICGKMSGGTDDKMAEAVEKSAFVIICVSKAYPGRPNCEQEAKFAKQKEKAKKLTIIYVMMQSDFTTVSQPESVDGWLRLYLGYNLWYPLWDEGQVESTGDAIAEVIGDHAKVQPVLSIPWSSLQFNSAANNLIGRGSFGATFKATWLPNALKLIGSQPVAVKVRTKEGAIFTGHCSLWRR